MLRCLGPPSGRLFLIRHSILWSNAIYLPLRRKTMGEVLPFGALDGPVCFQHCVGGGSTPSFTLLGSVAFHSGGFASWMIEALLTHPNACLLGEEALPGTMMLDSLTILKSLARGPIQPKPLARSQKANKAWKTSLWTWQLQPQHCILYSCSYTETDRCPHSGYDWSTQQGWQGPFFKFS